MMVETNANEGPYKNDSKYVNNHITVFFVTLMRPKTN